MEELCSLCHSAAVGCQVGSCLGMGLGGGCVWCSCFRIQVNVPQAGGVIPLSLQQDVIVFEHEDSILAEECVATMISKETH